MKTQITVALCLMMLLSTATYLSTKSTTKPSTNAGARLFPKKGKMLGIYVQTETIECSKITSWAIRYMPQEFVNEKTIETIDSLHTESEFVGLHDVHFSSEVTGV